MRALVNTLLLNGLFSSMQVAASWMCCAQWHQLARRMLYAIWHGVMQTLEDIPSEFFGGVLAVKKQQYHLHRLPNLFPTLPTLHKFVERYVTTSELNAREGRWSWQLWAACGVQCASGRRGCVRKRQPRVQASTRKSSAR